MTNYKFGWAVEYYAASVSEKDVPAVIAYIRNQEEHHRTKSWDEEYNEYLSLSGSGGSQG